MCVQAKCVYRQGVELSSGDLGTWYDLVEGVIRMKIPPRNNTDPGNACVRNST